MAANDPACARPAQAFDAHERARAYEIAAYLSAASFPFHNPDGPTANPIPNTDIALNALVQNGVHKMECDRAFLSFIDNRSQFICAEMTSRQSLVDMNPTRPLLLGMTRIPLEWGVCPYTMSIFHGREVELPASPYIVANKSYFYIKDFRQVPSFATRPYVAGYPRMVSYIEIPLRSLSGHILGSYCVVDDKERDFLQPDALRTIGEVTSAISQYLDLKRAEGGRLRSERMTDGLLQFIGSHHRIVADNGNTTDPFSLDIFKKPPRNGPEEPDIDGLKKSDQVPTCPIDSEVASEILPPTKLSSAPNTSEKINTSPSQDDTPLIITSSPLTRIDDLFSRAADLIGHAMNLDGLVFFDAVGSSTRYGGSHASFCSAGEGPVLPLNHGEQVPAQPLSEYQSDVTAKQQMVRRPSQALIRRLTAAYPHGYVFTVDEYGIFEQSDQGAEVSGGSSDTFAIHEKWEELFESIPKARYAIFLPLWHYQRESCFSTCLAWVSDPGKTLETNDINSLTAFGNSLMAEIFRLEAATSTQQKSDFISSVSHELRSPLHGILATVELIQDNFKDPRLLSMTQMIESCSFTLLGTFDHLLEFSKINSSKGIEQSAQLAHAKSSAGSDSAEKLTFDLGSLAEDVLEAVSLGHNSISRLESGLKREHRDPLANGVEVHRQSVLVTTCIDHRSTWSSHVDPGAWKRILLNIFSNSLRFTESGHIDVSLKMPEETDIGPKCISLSVTDTGVGMSTEFLKYHLFTPFMQENSLISGTGLGLSIVKSIVESLHGEIFVESRQHQGTSVTVNIPFHKELESAGQHEKEGNVRPHHSLSGLTISFISIASQDAPDNQLAPHDKLAPHIVAVPKLLHRSLRNICEKHLGMVVADDLPLHALLEKDIVLLDTHAISAIGLRDFQQQFPEIVSAMASRPVIILRSNPGEVEEEFVGLKGVVFTSSPVTRKSMRSAIIAAMSKVVLTEITPSQSTSINNQQPSHQAKRSVSEDLPTEDQLIITPSIPVNLPIRNDSLQAGSSAEEASSTIPRPQQPPALRTPPATAVDSPHPHLVYRFRRLLLVDDNPINLKLLVAFAKRTRLAFATASDGAEAVRLYKTAVEHESHPFDCVFMDISMPVMDGFQATLAIRQFEQQQQQHPKQRDAAANPRAAAQQSARANILALTGLGSEEARGMARDAGFDMFLMKPLRFRDIEPLLRHDHSNDIL